MNLIESSTGIFMNVAKFVVEQGKHRRRTTQALLLSSTAIAALSSYSTATFGGIIDTLNSGPALDAPANWSLGSVPTSANDALIGSGYPTATTTLTFTTATSATEDFGSLNDTNSVAITLGNPVNSTTVTLYLGTATTPNQDTVTGSALSDLIYSGSNSLTITSPQVGSSPGKLLLNLQQSGNFDIGGTALISSATSLNTFTMTKTGSGTLTMSGVISGSGGITVSAGTFAVKSSTNTFSGDLNIQAGGTFLFPSISNTSANSTMKLNGGVLEYFNNAGFDSTFSRNVVLNSSTSTFAVVASGTLGTQLDVTSAITGSGNLIVGGTLPAQYTGATALAFSVPNTYSGSTTVPTGQNLMLINTGNSATSALNLTGGILEVGSTHSSTSTVFSGVNIGVASSSIASVTAFNNLAPTTLAANLALPAITRSTGGTVDFSLPTSNAFTTPTANTAGTILGGYATANNQSTWAVSAGNGTTPGAITALSTFGSNYTAASTATDFDATTSGTFAATGINSMRFSTAGATTATLNGSFTVGSGGVLVTAAAGAGGTTITGGTSLTSGNGTDLIVHQYDSTAPLTINSTITGGIGLTKAGPGTLILSGSNTYIGNTSLLSGMLLAENGSGSATGSGAISILGGTYGGNGMSSGAIVVTSGTLKPGIGAGTAALTTGAVTFSSGTFADTINSNLDTADMLDPTSIALGNGLASLSLADSGNTVLSNTTPIVLIASNSLISGTFSGLTDGSSLTVGANTYTINYNTVIPDDVTLTPTSSAVPEPTGIAIVAVAGTGLLRRRRVLKS